MEFDRGNKKYWLPKCNQNMGTRETARELLFCVLLYQVMLHKFTERIMNINITFQNITATFLDLS